MHGHQPRATGAPLPPPPTTGSGVKPPPPGVILRGADRRLLRSVRKVLEMALADTAETLALPERRDVLEEVLADVLEELGAKVQPAAPEPEKPRTIRTADGREHVVR